MTENNTYTFEFGRETIHVTSKEVREFYPADHQLTENDIAQFAAERTAMAKYHSCGTQDLDVNMVKRLLDEEVLMKNGESDSAMVHSQLRWFIRIRKEAYERYAPFKYSVEADCLDNIQTFKRRYSTLEEAILHCLNGFNENPDIPGTYHSISEFLKKHSLGIR